MLTEQQLNILHATFLFSGCDLETLAGWAEEAGWTPGSFARGAVIFDPERFTKQLGILLSGRVRVAKQGMVVSELRTGDLFGAAALFNDEERYVSTLTARTRCEILFLSQAEVQRLMERDGRIQRSYIRYLSGRIRFLSDKIDALIEGSGERKLTAYLLGQMDADGRVDPGCSMTELAARLNMGRASLYRELQKLEERGALTRSGKAILIQKPELLRH